jgi:hypothetical protein
MHYRKYVFNRHRVRAIRRWYFSHEACRSVERNDVHERAKVVWLGATDDRDDLVLFPGGYHASDCFCLRPAQNADTVPCDPDPVVIASGNLLAVRSVDLGRT